MATEEEETGLERSGDEGVAERTWGELCVASVLQSPWWQRLTFPPAAQDQLPHWHSNPQGSWSKWHLSTWLPDQGMSERGPGSQMWSRQMLFIVIYVGLAESRCWWSFLINIFYSLKIKDENWSLELFNEILEIFKLCGFNKVHHAHGFFFLIYFYFRFLLCISTSLNVSNLHNNFPVNTISSLCGGSIN